MVAAAAAVVAWVMAILALAMGVRVAKREALAVTVATVATVMAVDRAGTVGMGAMSVAAAAAAAAGAVGDSCLRFRHRGRRWACVVVMAVALAAVGHLVVEDSAVEAVGRVGAAAVLAAVAVAAVAAVAETAVVAVVVAAVVAELAAGSRTDYYVGRTHRKPNST